MTETLEQRLDKLNALKQAELEGDNNPKYIEDLNLSIAQVEKQIGRKKANPKGYEMV